MFEKIFKPSFESELPIKIAEINLEARMAQETFRKRVEALPNMHPNDFGDEMNYMTSNELHEAAQKILS